MGEMIKMVVVLTILSIVSGGGLAKLEGITNPLFENNVMKFEKGPAIRAMLADAENDPVSDRFKIMDGETERNVFIGVFNGKANTGVMEAVASGYAGPVGLVVGINMDDQSLAGIAVTISTETAGLGSVAKDDPTWAAQFKGKSIEKPILVTSDGGDISAIGGATITSRAVCKGTTQAIESYNKLKPQLMEKIKETRN